jgi:periplasmic divalent cation tolerance protein
MLLIYTTHPDIACAQRIAGLLLDRQLIACANIYPIQSMYFWEGKLVSEGEYVAILKTTSNLLEDVRQVIQEHHPYEVPCIIHLPADANTSYLNWIEASTTQPNSGSSQVDHTA